MPVLSHHRTYRSGIRRFTALLLRFPHGAHIGSTLFGYLQILSYSHRISPNH